MELSDVSDFTICIHPSKLVNGQEFTISNPKDYSNSIIWVMVEKDNECLSESEVVEKRWSRIPCNLGCTQTVYVKENKETRLMKTELKRLKDIPVGARVKFEGRLFEVDRGSVKFLRALEIGVDLFPHPETGMDQIIEWKLGDLKAGDKFSFANGGTSIVGQEVCTKLEYHEDRVVSSRIIKHEHKDLVPIVTKDNKILFSFSNNAVILENSQ